MLANAHHQGYKIIEAPVEIKFKKDGWGRINPRDIWHIALDTAAVFYRMHILRYYDREH